LAKIPSGAKFGNLIGQGLKNAAENLRASGVNSLYNGPAPSRPDTSVTDRQPTTPQTTDNTPVSFKEMVTVSAVQALSRQGLLGSYLASKTRTGIKYQQDAKKDFETVKEAFGAVSKDFLKTNEELKKVRTDISATRDRVQKVVTSVNSVLKGYSNRLSAVERRLTSLESRQKTEMMRNPYTPPPSLIQPRTTPPPLPAMSTTAAVASAVGSVASAAGNIAAGAGGMAAMSRFGNLLKKPLVGALGMTAGKLGARLIPGVGAGLALYGAYSGYQKYGLKGAVTGAIGIDDLVHGGAQASPQRPAHINPGLNYRSPQISPEIIYERMQLEQQKSRFLQYGQLPQGFEFAPGYNGTLGNPSNVRAGGAMPLSGTGSFGATGFSSGGRSSMPPPSYLGGPRSSAGGVSSAGSARTSYAPSSYTPPAASAGPPAAASSSRGWNSNVGKSTVDMLSSGSIDRSSFDDQLKDPKVRNALVARVNIEVGSQGARSQQMMIESILNRASSRKLSIMQAVNNHDGYYPQKDNDKWKQQAQTAQRNDLHGLVDVVHKQGSDISKGATGNASGSVGVGRPTAEAGGERYGRERSDAKWNPTYRNSDTASLPDLKLVPKELLNSDVASSRLQGISGSASNAKVAATGPGAGPPEIHDASKEAGFGFSKGRLNKVEGLVVHHTAGGGSENYKGTINTFKQRGYPAHYVMERDGRIVRTLEPGAMGWHTQKGGSGTAGERGLGYSNRNTEGIEVIAKDNKDWTPAQVEAMKRFQVYHADQHGYDPLRSTFGHGELNKGKQADEGMAFVSQLREPGAYDKWKSQYSGSNVDLPKMEQPGVLPMPPQPPSAKQVEQNGKASFGNVVESQNQAGVRKLPLKDELKAYLDYAAKKSGVQYEVTSGGQSRRTGRPDRASNRHSVDTPGIYGAADGKMFVMENGQKRYLSVNNKEDLPLIQNFTKHFASVAPSAGVGMNYMSRGTASQGQLFHFGGPNKAGDPAVMYEGRDRAGTAFDHGRKMFGSDETKAEFNKYLASLEPNKAEFKGSAGSQQDGKPVQGGVATSLEKPYSPAEVEGLAAKGKKYAEYDPSQAGADATRIALEKKGISAVAYNRGMGNPEWGESQKSAKQVVSEIGQLKEKYVHLDNAEMFKGGSGMKYEDFKYIVDESQKMGKTVIPKNPHLNDYLERYMKERPDFKPPYVNVEDVGKLSKQQFDSLAKLKQQGVDINGLDWKGNVGSKTAKDNLDRFSKELGSVTVMQGGGSQPRYDDRGAETIAGPGATQVQPAVASMPAAPTTSDVVGNMQQEPPSRLGQFSQTVQTFENQAKAADASVGPAVAGVDRLGTMAATASKVEPAQQAPASFVVADQDNAKKMFDGEAIQPPVAGAPAPAIEQQAASPSLSPDRPAIAGGGASEQQVETKAAEAGAQAGKESAQSSADVPSSSGGGQSSQESSEEGGSAPNFGNHPESQAPEQGSGGYGSHGRCYV
jgi:hypothetical protein